MSGRHFRFGFIPQFWLFGSKLRTNLKNAQSFLVFFCVFLTLLRPEMNEIQLFLKLVDVHNASRKDS